jgi:signal transduction histidine kinase
VELGIESDLMNALGSLGRTAIRTRLLVESLLHDARATVRPLEREPVELERLVHDCVALLYPEVKARSAVVSVGSLPVVRAEPALLAGLITNLLSNALKFNPRQGGAIAVHAARSDNGWEISVENEGPPIALEDRERIFEPFYRGRHERRIKGAGLGLAICRRIVERHEGRIGVAVEGDRNRFFFVLPD